MFTESEAMTKECRLGGQITPGRFPKCSASHCMGWRWVRLAEAPYLSPITGKQIAGAIEAKGECGWKAK